MVALETPAISSTSVLSFECPAELVSAVHTLAAKHALSPESVVTALVLQPLIDQLSEVESVEARLVELSPTHEDA